MKYTSVFSELKDNWVGCNVLNAMDPVQLMYSVIRCFSFLLFYPLFLQQKDHCTKQSLGSPEVATEISEKNFLLEVAEITA